MIIMRTFDQIYQEKHSFYHMNGVHHYPSIWCAPLYGVHHYSNIWCAVCTIPVISVSNAMAQVQPPPIHNIDLGLGLNTCGNSYDVHYLRLFHCSSLKVLNESQKFNELVRKSIKSSIVGKNKNNVSKNHLYLLS